jgi:DNA-binding LytR/AlgR family response regulator
MITIAICDDVREERKRAKEFCRRYFVEKKERYEVFEYGSGEGFLEQSLTDVLLLDVEMKGIGGIKLKEVLQLLWAKTRIIFISEHEEYMEQAFGKNVFGFLRKPLEYASFCEKMDAVMDDIHESRSYIYCKENIDYDKVYRKIFFREIVYIEAQGNKTYVYTELGKKCVVSDKRISEWGSWYRNEGFVYSHRSCVVNLKYVVKIGEDVELISGIRVPLGRDRREVFCQELGEYNVRTGKRGLFRKES